MEWKHENNVLVILGGWNANILLNIDWLKKYLFPKQEKFKVEMPIGPMFSGPPIVSTDKIRISLVGPKLCFAPLEPDLSLLDYIEGLGTKLADYLPHTPVSAVGINFLFELEDDSSLDIWHSQSADDVLRTFGEIQEELHRYTLPLDKSSLNLTVRQASGANQAYDFNFNHQVKSLADFKELVAECHIIEYNSKAEEVMKTFIGSKEQAGEKSNGNG